VKKNKKKLVAIMCLIVIIMLIISLLFINNSQKELVLLCKSETYKNEYYSMDRSVNVYKKNNELFYSASIMIEKFTDDEKINEAIDFYFKYNYIEEKKNGNDSFTLNEDNRKTGVTLELNLSKCKKEEAIKLIGTDNLSVLGIKEFFEKEGLTCEEY